MQRLTVPLIVALLLGAIYLTFAHPGRPPAPISPPPRPSSTPPRPSPPTSTPIPSNLMLAEVVTPQNRDRLLQFVRGNSNLPFEDRLLFARGMARVFFGDGNDGKTVAQVIAEQRALEQAPARPPKPKHHVQRVR